MKNIKLDNWSIHKIIFENEAMFRCHLITNVNELNNNKDDDDYNFALLNQDEIVISDVNVAYISFDLSGLEGVQLKFPVFAKYPGMTQEEFEVLERGEKLIEVFGISRGNLQWQIQNALSGLPLFDHCFPESLTFGKTINGRPYYGLSLGS